MAASNTGAPEFYQKRNLQLMQEKEDLEEEVRSSGVRIQELHDHNLELIQEKKDLEEEALSQGEQLQELNRRLEARTINPNHPLRYQELQVQIKQRDERLRSLQEQYERSDQQRCQEIQRLKLELDSSQQDRRSLHQSIDDSEKCMAELRKEIGELEDRARTQRVKDFEGLKRELREKDTLLAKQADELRVLGSQSPGRMGEQEVQDSTLSQRYKQPLHPHRTPVGPPQNITLSNVQNINVDAYPPTRKGRTLKAGADFLRSLLPTSAYLRAPLVLTICAILVLLLLWLLSGRLNDIASTIIRRTFPLSQSALAKAPPNASNVTDLGKLAECSQTFTMSIVTQSGRPLVKHIAEVKTRSMYVFW